jgi:hypothetical protein
MRKLSGIIVIISLMSCSDIIIKASYEKKNSKIGYRSRSEYLEKRRDSGKKPSMERRNRNKCKVSGNGERIE